MRLLFDVLHPAQVHLFRHLIERSRRDGGEALVLAREKDVIVRLCERYRIPHYVASRARPGLLGGGRELLARTMEVWKAARRFKPHALLGTSMSIGLVGRLIGKPSFVFNEDDRKAVPITTTVAYPLCTYVVTPQCLAHENYGERHLTYPGYHELAYLHPNHFTPDPAVPGSMGLDPDRPYFVLRLVALRAHHDRRARGIPYASVKKLVELLAGRGRVLITGEAEMHPELERYRFPLSPDKLHDLLAFASLYIGDSQTMAAEAAVLGVPSLRCSSFVGRISYLTELEKTYELTRGFLPDAFEDLLNLTRDWLCRLDEVKAEAKKKRFQMLARSVDVSEWQWRTLREKVGEA